VVGAVAGVQIGRGCGVGCGSEWLVGLNFTPKTHTDEPEPRIDVACVTCSFCAIEADG